MGFVQNRRVPSMSLSLESRRMAVVRGDQSHFAKSCLVSRIPKRQRGMAMMNEREVHERRFCLRVTSQPVHGDAH
jgi:hypothetical protein